MVILKIAVDAICGVLNALGGYHWLFCRRFIMPVLLAVTISFVSHIWWLGFLVLPTIGTLCLGYPRWGKFGRGFWLFLQSVVLGLGLFLTGHLFWYFYLIYVVVSGVLGGSLVNLDQIIGDFIFGVWLGVIVYLVH